MWEQMSLAHEYGVDRLWVLNVGDLKPMEYPITLFLDMAWNPTRYTPKTLRKFTERFCAEIFGEKEAKESARILDLTSRWACRCTPELLNKDTYDLKSGEWAKVAGDYARLAKEWNCDFDDRGAIGKRYRRQDEIGTPYCVTYDFDSETDGAVTVRDRDSMEQERVKIEDLTGYFREKLAY